MFKPLNILMNRLKSLLTLLPVKSCLQDGEGHSVIYLQHNLQFLTSDLRLLKAIWPNFYIFFFAQECRL